MVVLLLSRLKMVGLNCLFLQIPKSNPLKGGEMGEFQKVRPEKKNCSGGQPERFLLWDVGERKVLCKKFLSMGKEYRKNMTGS